MYRVTCFAIVDDIEMIKHIFYISIYEVYSNRGDRKKI